MSAAMDWAAFAMLPGDPTMPDFEPVSEHPTESGSLVALLSRPDGT
jgi:hypothetical protein